MFHHASDWVLAVEGGVGVGWGWGGAGWGGVVIHSTEYPAFDLPL